MLKGLGCDLVEVARVEDAMKKEGFAQRVFTEQEQLYIQKKGVQTAADLVEKEIARWKQEDAQA